MERLQRLDPDLNAYTFKFEPGLLAELQQAYLQELAPFLQRPANRRLFSRRGAIKQPVGPEPADYYIFNYLGNPLLWLSNHSARTLAIFERLYRAMGVEHMLKPLIDHQERIVMYSGFFVVGDRFEGPSWHQDFVYGSHAYTLITPLFELDADHGRLSYQHLDESPDYYSYQPGEAILFGAGFSHSTESYGPSRRPRVLISFTCGTDKFQYWDKILRTIKGNSYYYRQPCGHLIGSCQCQASYQIALQYSRNYLKPF